MLRSKGRVLEVELLVLMSFFGLWFCAGGVCLDICCVCLGVFVLSVLLVEGWGFGWLDVDFGSGDRVSRRDVAGVLIEWYRSVRFGYCRGLADLVFKASLYVLAITKVMSTVETWNKDKKKIAMIC